MIIAIISNRLMRKVGVLEKVPRKVTATGYEVPKNIKSHLTCHFPRQIRLFGANSEPYNAALGEKYHHDVVNVAFHSSSRLKETTTREMALIVVRRELSRIQALACTCFVQSSQAEHERPSLSGSDDSDEDKSEDDVIEDNPLLATSDSEELMSFHPVRKLGSVQLITCDTDDMLMCANHSRGTAFLHPLLEMKELFTLIIRSGRRDICLDRLFKKIQQKSPCTTMYLYGGVRSSGSSSAGVKPFYIRANRNYSGNSRTRTDRRGKPVFNSFEVDYDQSTYAEGDEQTTFGKTFANVVFMSDDKCYVYVAFARYKKVRPTGRVRIPFDMYAFESTALGRLSLDLIEIHSVKRPCFMVSSCDAPSSRRFENKTNIKDMRWFCIPFHRAVLNENCAYSNYSAYTASEEGTSTFQTRSEINSQAAVLGLSGSNTFSMTSVDEFSLVASIDKSSRQQSRLSDAPDTDTETEEEESDAESDKAEWDS